MLAGVYIGDRQLTASFQPATDDILVLGDGCRIHAGNGNTG